MTRVVPDWGFADAWVFAAIGGFRRPCSLPELIGAADWMNHAILLREETEDALGKLAGSGLVRVFEDWTLELTDEGASLWSAETRDVSAQLEKIQQELAAFEPLRVAVRIPPRTWEKAVGDYQDR